MAVGVAVQWCVVGEGEGEGQSVVMHAVVHLKSSTRMLDGIKYHLCISFHFTYLFVLLRGKGRCE